jgi:hypothetical protein
VRLIGIMFEHRCRRSILLFGLLLVVGIVIIWVRWISNSKQIGMTECRGSTFTIKHRELKERNTQIVQVLSTPLTAQVGPYAASCTRGCPVSPPPLLAWRLEIQWSSQECRCLALRIASCQQWGDSIATRQTRLPLPLHTPTITP